MLWAGMNIEEYQLSGRASYAASVESKQGRLQQAMTWEQRRAVRDAERIKRERGEPEIDASAVGESEG